MTLTLVVAPCPVLVIVESENPLKFSPSRVVICWVFTVTEENVPKQVDDLGSQFTEIFIKQHENVTLLLTLVEVSNRIAPGAGVSKRKLNIEAAVASCAPLGLCRSLTSMFVGLE